MDVVLLRWPAEEPRRVQLREGGVARLLLVDAELRHRRGRMTTSRTGSACRPTRSNLHARVENLDRRARTRIDGTPALDSDGVLRVNGTWVSLPPVEARLTARCSHATDRWSAVRPLGFSGWPEGAPGRNALDVHVLRLRRRIAPLGLAIRTVRSRGYLLE